MNLPVHGALCGLRKLAVRGLLPHVGVDVAGDALFLLGGETWGRELGVRLQMVWDNLSCLGTEALARLG